MEENSRFNIKREVTYSDIDLFFNIHPARHDLMLSTDEMAVSRSIKNLILTNHYERLFHPEIGGNIKKMLFEPAISLTTNFIEKEVYDVINNFEPRAKVIDVTAQFTSDQNLLDVTITYLLLNSTEPTVLKLPLSRE